VPQALATGSIDGQENPYNIIVSSGIHENTDYVLETNHMHTPLAIILNEDLWQGFDEETQQIFYDAVREIQPRATDLIEENIEGHREAVRNEGGQIIPPEELDMDAFRTQVRSHIREQFPDFIETIETIHGGEYR
jgi:TRAP-type C4-dicarboxylate transport system substrate-binding protein